MNKLNAFLEELLVVPNVDLKFIFDHFRNYAIAGAILFAAVRLAGGAPTVFMTPYFGKSVGVLFFLLSIALFTLNFIQGANAFFSVAGKPQNRWKAASFVGAFTLWFFIAQELWSVQANALLTKRPPATAALASSQDGLSNHTGGKP